MTFLNASKHADCFGIQSKREAPMLAFLYYLLQTYNEKAVVISGFEKKYFSKMTAATKLQGINAYIDVVNLRSDWKINKQRYRYGFLYKELEIMISKSEYPIVILHSIGDFFEFQDGNEVETFVDKLINICNSADKRLIYTLDTDQELSSIISKAFHNHLDLELSMKKEDNQHTLVSINHSIESVRYNSYRFFMPKADKFVFETYLKDDELKEKAEDKLIVPRIILTGDDGQNIERISYFFNKEKFDLEVVEPSMSSILTKLMSNPHMLIYATKESFHDERRYELCNSAKEQELRTSIVYITGSEFVRNSDKRMAVANFCGDMFEQNFNIEAFVTSLEKILKIPFYSKSLKTLPTMDKIVKTEYFENYKTECLKSNIFFTQLTYRYKKEINKEALKSILSRFGDCATIISSQQKVILLLLNTSIHQSHIFNEKMREIDKDIIFIQGDESVSINA